MPRKATEKATGSALAEINEAKRKLREVKKKHGITTTHQKDYGPDGTYGSLMGKLKAIVAEADYEIKRNPHLFPNLQLRLG
jgi:hypothetical protein